MNIYICIGGRFDRSACRRSASLSICVNMNGCIRKFTSNTRNQHTTAEALSVPMAKPAKERLNRSVAFDNTAEDISKWTSVVKRNREVWRRSVPSDTVCACAWLYGNALTLHPLQAEHLSFPLNPPSAPAHSNAALTMKFKVCEVRLLAHLAWLG